MIVCFVVFTVLNVDFANGIYSSVRGWIGGAERYRRARCEQEVQSYVEFLRDRRDRIREQIDPHAAEPTPPAGPGPPPDAVPHFPPKRLKRFPLARWSVADAPFTARIDTDIVFSPFLNMQKEYCFLISFFS